MLLRVIKIKQFYCIVFPPIQPYNQANLSKILMLRKTYNLPVGYSDHVLGFDASIAAVSLEASRQRNTYFRAE